MYLRASLALLVIILYGCNSTDNAPVVANSLQEDATSTSPQADSDAPRTADYDELKNPYFGQTHLHNGWSFDEAIYNVMQGPENAYIHARGERVRHPNGDYVQL